MFRLGDCDYWLQQFKDLQTFIMRVYTRKDTEVKNIYVYIPYDKMKELVVETDDVVHHIKDTLNVDLEDGSSIIVTRLPMINPIYVRQITNNVGMINASTLSQDELELFYANIRALI